MVTPSKYIIKNKHDNFSNLQVDVKAISKENFAKI